MAGEFVEPSFHDGSTCGFVAPLFLSFHYTSLRDGGSSQQARLEVPWAPLGIGSSTACAPARQEGRTHHF